MVGAVGWRAVALAIVLFHPLVAYPQTRTTPRLRYLANEGVVLEGAGGRVFIDALFGDGLPEYPTVPPASRDSLERALGWYGGSALVLTTHAHRDHFDSAAVARYRRHNPRAVIPDPPRQDAPFPEPMDLGWVRVRPLPIPHGGTVRPVGHAAYLVTLDGMTAVHLGDTQSDPATWQSAGMPPAGVDVAMVPFWLASAESGIEAILEATGAKTVVLLHAPTAEATRARHALGRRFPQVRVPLTPGEVVDLVH
jgi:L-ascorbate metabolism protein UlaG (beta-lactamase superfamily)